LRWSAEFAELPDPRTFGIEGRSSVVRKAAKSPLAAGSVTVVAAAGSVTVVAMVLALCFGLFSPLSNRLLY
jgi:hypothetical protein